MLICSIRQNRYTTLSTRKKTIRLFINTRAVLKKSEHKIKKLKIKRKEKGGEEKLHILSSFRLQMIEGIKDHFVLYSHSSDYSLFTWNFLKAIKFSSHRQLSNCYMSEISLSALFQPTCNIPIWCPQNCLCNSDSCLFCPPLQDVFSWEQL